MTGSTSPLCPPLRPNCLYHSARDEVALAIAAAALPDLLCELPSHHHSKTALRG
jgi:hypothetical protein